MRKLFEANAPDGSQPGRVLVEHRGSYVVGTADGDVNAKVTGRFRHDAALAEDFPAVGDWVALGDRLAKIGRHSCRSAAPDQFLRPGRGDTAGAQVVAANVDLVLLVTGLDHDFNLRRLERYVTLALSSGAEPVIVLNKADLCEDVAETVGRGETVAPGVPVRVLSAREGTGLESLRPLLEQGKTVALHRIVRRRQVDDRQRAPWLGAPGDRRRCARVTSAAGTRPPCASCWSPIWARC